MYILFAYSICEFEKLAVKGKVKKIVYWAFNGIYMACWDRNLCLFSLGEFLSKYDVALVCTDWRKWLMREKIQKSGIVIVGIFFIIICHGYRFFDLMYSHDSLLVVQNDYIWQISLGRWLQPVIVMLRGYICAPLLIMVLQGLFLISASYMIIDLFCISNKLNVIMVIGVLVTNITITLTNATYLPWSDMFALSLFLAVLSVYAFEKIDVKPIKYIVVIFSVCAMLAIYQAYLSVLLGLILISLILLDNEKTIMDYLKIIAQWFCCLLIAGIIYYVTWKLIVHFMDITVADTYNGLSNAKVGFRDLVARALGTYPEFFVYFSNPSSYTTLYSINPVISAILVISNWICIVSSFVIVILKSKGLNRLYNIILCCLFPLALGFVKIFSGETFHSLMKYSYVLVYVFLIIILDRYIVDWRLSIKRAVSIVTSLCIILLVWNNIVFANQAYTEKALQEKQTFAYVTNLVNRIEAYPGYIAGVTPVNFVGTIEGSGYFDDALGWGGISSAGYSTTMITYRGVLTEYLNTMINTNMVFSELETSEATVGMPNYPSDGSIAIINDTMYVKLSD